jgi:fumarate reductase subunit C
MMSKDPYLNDYMFINRYCIIVYPNRIKLVVVFVELTQISNFWSTFFDFQAKNLVVSLLILLLVYSKY